MKLYTEIKPNQKFDYIGNKKDLMKHVLSGLTYVNNPYIEGYVFKHTDKKYYIRVFNFIKHNRKVERYANRIIPAYWELYIYDIPFDVAVSMNIKFVQCDRNFKIVNL